MSGQRSQLVSPDQESLDPIHSLQPGDLDGTEPQTLPVHILLLLVHVCLHQELLADMRTPSGSLCRCVSSDVPSSDLDGNGCGHVAGLQCTTHALQAVLAVPLRRGLVQHPRHESISTAARIAALLARLVFDANLVKQLTNEVAVSLHGGIHQHQHGTCMDLLLVDGQLQSLGNVARSFHYEFAHVLVVVVLNCRDEGLVEAVWFQLFVAGLLQQI